MFLVIPLIYSYMGLIGTFASLLLFPATLLIAPWFDALANGHWLLVEINYGGIFLSGIIATLAKSLANWRN